jgi:hypothetical protein
MEDRVSESRSTNNENPLTPAIGQTWEQLRSLEWHGSGAIAAAISASILSVVLALFVILWPYGVVVVVSSTIWQLVVETRAKITSSGLVGKMPFTVAIGLYFLVWLPFALVCVPFYVIGIVGHLLSADEAVAAEQSVSQRVRR